MLKNLKKKKVINNQNSHYFIYLCIILSSKFLQNNYWLYFFARKIKKKNKMIKFCFITIQYLISSFFYFKNLFKFFINNNTNQSFRKYLYYSSIKHSLFNKIILYYINSVQIFFFNFFFGVNIKKKNQIFKAIFFLKNTKQKIISIENFSLASNRYGLISYNQLLKILNHHKFTFGLPNQLNFFYFGSIKYSIKRNLNYNKSLPVQNIQYINLISIRRLYKLRSIYFEKKYNQHKFITFKIKKFIFFYFKEFCKKIFFRFFFIKNKIWQKFLFNVQKKYVKILRLIVFRIKKAVNAKIIKKINKDEYFINETKVFILRINFYFKNLIEHFLIIKNENKKFFL